MVVTDHALFPTRLVSIQFTDTDGLNDELCGLFRERSEFTAGFDMHPDSLNLLRLAETVPAVARLRDMFLNGLNHWLAGGSATRPAGVDLVLFSNYAARGEMTLVHNHNADLVGVYYARTERHDRPTVLEPDVDDDYFEAGNGVLVLHDPRFNANLAAVGHRDYVKVLPRPGLMLIFPGYLWHSVTPHLGDVHRLSFSMNFTLRWSETSNAIRFDLSPTENADPLGYNDAVRISFVVPAHNEEALLGRTLTAIHSSTMPLGEPYEIVVADDASTDRTPAIAGENGARVVPLDRRQIAAARNAGAWAANGEYLIFVDADTVATRQVVAAALRTLHRGAIGGGCSVKFDGPVPFYGRIIEGVLRVFSPPVGLAAGCFLFCTRRAFETVGGFDESLFATEEVVFANRLKRLGRFVVLRECVYTSGRKVRTHSALDMIRIGLRLGRGGSAALRRREGMEFWYGPRVRPNDDGPLPGGAQPTTH